MKKAVLFFLSLIMICACGSDDDILDEESQTDIATIQSVIVGDWIPSEKSNLGFYWSFDKNYVYYYEMTLKDEYSYLWKYYGSVSIPYAEYSDFTLYIPHIFKWKLKEKHPYEIIGNDIYVNGYNTGSITLISRNKATFDSSYLVDGVCERVKYHKERTIDLTGFEN